VTFTVEAMEIAKAQTAVIPPYLSGLFGLGFVGRPVGSVMFFASGLVACPCDPDSGFLSRDCSVSPR
jgi:hypothetical protein